jgi:hypothetical protein
MAIRALSQKHKKLLCQAVEKGERLCAMVVHKLTHTHVVLVFFLEERPPP